MPHQQPLSPDADSFDRLSNCEASHGKPAARRNACWVDVSHGLGIPFGGIGTGYLAFGKYGFVKVNFNSNPDPETLAYDGGAPMRHATISVSPPTRRPSRSSSPRLEEPWRCRKHPLPGNRRRRP
jgi:hypothetical protein